MSHHDLPLRGVRILDLSRLLAGNMLTLQLADFGAEVVKIEPPGGDPLRRWTSGDQALWWKVYARNKKSVCLDLKQADDVERLLRMVADADVLVESFKPGGMEKFGLSMETLHRRNPKLVVVRISGWGQTGPYASRPGFGTLIEAFSGFAEKNGFPDKPPALPNLGLADMIAGISGAAATLIALREVEINSGLGQVVDLSLLEPMLAVMGPDPAIFSRTGQLPRRIGNRSDTAAPRNAYACSDGQWLVISGSTQDMAERIFRAIGQASLIEDPRFASNQARLKNAEALDALIGSFVGQGTLDEILARFSSFGVTAGAIYNVAQLLQDPHVLERECITEFEDARLGALPMHNVFPRLSRTPGSIRSLGPELRADQNLADGP